VNIFPIYGIIIIICYFYPFTTKGGILVKKTYLFSASTKMMYFNKANDLYNKKDYKEALNLYKKSIELKENEAASLYNAAVCLIKLRSFENAISLIKRAVKLKEDSRYYFNLGYCYAMLKNSPKALLYFNTAWSLDNTDSDCEKAIKLLLDSFKK
jgi:tetratricopeptide (TPR) repeat protein